MFRQVRQFLRLFAQDFSDDGVRDGPLLHVQEKDILPEFNLEFPEDVLLLIAHDRELAAKFFIVDKSAWLV